MNQEENLSKKKQTNLLKIYLFCPIPEDQKPINLYIKLKERFLINWILFSNKNLIQRILVTFCSFFLFFCLLTNKTSEYSYEKTFFSFIELNTLLSTFFFQLFFLILFFLWKDMKQSFTNSSLFYEEASWFDGQFWEKPFFLIKNDKLLTKRKLQPTIKRILYIIYLFSINLIILLVSFYS